MSVGTAGAIGLGLAGAGAAIGGIAQASAGNAQADAAKKGVDLAQTALQQQIQARADSIAAAQKVAALSPNEIGSINKLLSTRDAALSASLSSIQKQQTALDAIDPNVKAAGSNLYDLLSGKAAAVLAPMQTQLSQQRQKMMDQLSSQMGPGFMTSSAGIQALTQFDNQAALTLNNAQMNAIQTIGSQYGNLSGLQQQGQNAVTGATGSAYGAATASDAAALQAYQFGQTRETNATLGAMSSNPINPFGVANAQQGVINTAGAPYAGAASIGGTIAGLGGNLIGAGVAGAMNNANNPFANPGGSTQQIGPWAGGYGGGNMNGGYNGGASAGGYSGNFGANIAM